MASQRHRYHFYTFLHFLTASTTLQDARLHGADGSNPTAGPSVALQGPTDARPPPLQEEGWPGKDQHKLMYCKYYVQLVYKSHV